MVESSIASTTRDAYGTSWRQFTDFLTSNNIPPITKYERDIEVKLDGWLSNFAAYGSHTKSWLASTISSKIAGVKKSLIGLGYPVSLSIPITSSVIMGITRNEDRLKCNSISNGTLPQARTTTPPLPPKAIMIGCQYADQKGDPLVTEWATAQLTAFWLLLRKSEICPDSGNRDEIKHITFACIRFLQFGCQVDDFRQASAVSVFIPNGKSKSNNGVVITMPGGLKESVDLVTRLGKYVERAKSQPGFSPSNPVFPNTSPHHLKKFMHRCLATFTPDQNKVKSFTLHSLRHGGATALAEVGLPLDSLKSHGRWSSNAYKKYVQGGIGGMFEAAEKLTMWMEFLSSSSSSTRPW